MITAAELGIPQAEYDAIMNEDYETVRGKLIAHRLNPNFAQIGGTLSGTAPFYAVLTDTYLMVANASGTLHRYHLGTGVWDTKALPVSQETQLAWDANTLTLYSFVPQTITFAGIYRRASTDYGTTWGTAEYCSTGISSSMVGGQWAVASPTEVIVVYNDSTSGTKRLLGSRYDGAAWVGVGSDIYYPFPIADIDAVSYNGSVFIYLVTELPGLFSAENEDLDDDAEKYWEQTAALIGFKADLVNNIWSWHFEIASVPQLNNPDSFSGVRAMVMNDRLSVCTYRTIGYETTTETHPYEYTSFEGEYYSIPERIPINNATAVIKMLYSGNDLFAVSSDGKVWRGAMTMRYGYDNSAVREDITEYVKRHSISRTEDHSAEVELDNSTGYFDDHPIVGVDCSTMFQHYASYLRDGDWVDVKVCETYVDAFTFEKRGGQSPRSGLQVSSRSIGRNLTDVKQAEDFRILYPSNLIMEEYPAGEELAHFALISGVAEPPLLTLKTETAGQRAIGLSTHLYSPFNVQMTATLNIGSGESGGIILRYGDENNNVRVTVERTADVRMRIDVTRNGSGDGFALSGNILGVTWPITLTVTLRYNYVTAAVLATTLTHVIKVGTLAATGNKYLINGLQNYPAGNIGYTSHAFGGTVSGVQFTRLQLKELNNGIDLFSGAKSYFEAGAVKTDPTTSLSTAVETDTIAGVFSGYSNQVVVSDAALNDNLFNPNYTNHIKNEVVAQWNYAGEQTDIYLYWRAGFRQATSTYYGDRYVQFAIQVQDPVLLTWSTIGYIGDAVNAFNQYDTGAAVNQQDPSGNNERRRAPFTISAAYNANPNRRIIVYKTWYKQFIVGPNLWNFFEDPTLEIPIYEIAKLVSVSTGGTTGKTTSNGVNITFLKTNYTKVGGIWNSTASAGWKFWTGVDHKFHIENPAGVVTNSTNVVYDGESVSISLMRILTGAVYVHYLTVQTPRESINLTYTPGASWASTIHVLGMVVTSVFDPSVDEIVAMTLDPGETPMSALNRMMDGRPIKTILRFNGMAKLLQYTYTASVLTFTEALDLQTTIDNRELYTHVRMLGAYVEAEYIDLALMLIHGKKFMETNNPYLMSVAECYNEAKKTVKRMQESAEQGSAAYVFYPALELDDRITILDQGDWIINAIQIEFDYGVVRASYNFRRFIS